MPEIFLYAVTIIIIFISAFTRSALGFADALIAMPLLSMVLGIKTAAPLVALVATTLSGIILLRNWQQVDLQASWRMIVASFLGIPCGILLLKGIPEPLMKTLLGLCIILFSLYSLINPHLVLTRDRFGLAYVFGFLAGMLGGAYNMVGPLIVLYGHLRSWPPERFRATLQSCFLPAYAGIVIGHSASGLITTRVLLLYGYALPLIGVAIWLGAKLNAALPQDRFRRYVNLGLVSIGVLLCVQAWLA